MKNYLFFFALFNLSLFQSQQIKISNLKLSIPPNFIIADQKLLADEKTSVVKDKKYSNLIENFDVSEFLSPKTYFYKNKQCNCMNTFQIMLADYNFSNNNADFSPNSKAADNLIFLYEESTKDNVKKLNEINTKASISISPMVIQNTNKVNIIYYQTEYELIKPSTGKLTKYISDNYIIPQKDYFYVTFFNFEKENYKQLNPILKEYSNSIRLD